MIWPALYIAGSVYKFWFLVFLTIAVEAIFIKFFLKTTTGKSILISAVGNLVSGLVGTFIMVFASLIYDAIIGILFFNSSFTIFNWISSYVIMCFGSILIEILVIKVIWKFEFKSLILPLSIGNVISYFLIIFLNNFNIFYNKLTN